MRPSDILTDICISPYTSCEVTIMPEKENMVRLTFYMEEKAKARLEKLHELTDRSVAVMIRRAIDAYLDAEEAALRRRK
jgi:ribbon-helix-helix CopG family protein